MGGLLQIMLGWLVCHQCDDIMSQDGFQASLRKHSITVNSIIWHKVHFSSFHYCQHNTCLCHVLSSWTRKTDTKPEWENGDGEGGRHELMDRWTDEQEVQRQEGQQKNLNKMKKWTCICVSHFYDSTYQKANDGIRVILIL